MAKYKINFKANDTKNYEGDNYDDTQKIRDFYEGNYAHAEVEEDYTDINIVYISDSIKNITCCVDIEDGQTITKLDEHRAFYVKLDNDELEFFDRLGGYELDEDFAEAYGQDLTDWFGVKNEQV